MKKVSFECDNCGAKVPATQARPGVHKCEYCGHEFRITPTQQPKPKPAPRPTPQPQRRARARRGGRRGAGGVAIVAVFAVMAAALGAWLFFSKGSGGRGSKVLSSVLGERLTWDHVGGDPAPVDIGGVEHVVSRVRSTTRDGQLSIMVVNSRTLEQRWRTPDLGTYSEAYRAVRYAVVGDRVLVSDKRNVLHVYDAKDGKELNAHHVTDRVEQLCPMPEGTAVWVQVLDKRHLLFDVKSLAAKEALKRPAHCPRSVFMARRRTSRLPRGAAPRVKGMRTRRLFRQGELAVVLGEKHPGTKIPLVAGVEPKRRGEVLWQKPLAAVNPTSVRTSFNRWFGGIGGKRFIAPYGVGSKAWHVVALDAQTGDQLWDVTLRELFAVDLIKAFVVTEGFVYVGRTSSLEVLDAKDGKLLGAVGNETYRR